MSPEDFKEYSAIKRRMEFLELRASCVWKYRREDILRSYADVAEGLTLKPITTEKEKEQ